MFYNKKLKSDYVSIFNNDIQQTLPSGYPCTFNSDCKKPGVCQFNVCTVNIGGNEISDLANICRGMSIRDCAKEMQKEREKTEVPIYIPNFPNISPNNTGSTGGNGGTNIKNINTYSKCNYDKDCNKNEVCITGTCINKSNFPLIARQQRLKATTDEINKQNIYTLNNTENDFNIKKFFQHKKTPLDGSLNAYEYMFLLEKNLNNDSIVDGLHDDYFYFKN